jgi:hypothetical protein
MSVNTPVQDDRDRPKDYRLGPPRHEPTERAILHGENGPVAKPASAKARSIARAGFHRALHAYGV